MKPNPHTSKALRFIITLAATASTLALAAPAAETAKARPADANGTSQSGTGHKRAAHSGHAEKVSDLIGKPVKNKQNENIGKVENLMVDLSSGRIIAVIVSSGGFIGMGDELSAVPAAALSFKAERDTLQMDASKESLSKAAHFKAGEWPDFSQPGYAQQINGGNRGNRDKSAANTGSVPDADNTARNARDRDASTLTPLDQGSSKDDLSITTQIRKEVVAAKDMSVNGQNVKIITVNGKVTLRGPVASADEKRAIGDIAIKATRRESVDNQLEVK